MADNPFELSNLGQAPTGGADVTVSANQSKIGDLRRRYNFGASVSELAIDQTPFFRFVSQVASSPTDDPEFKSTEERSMWMKRYAYIQGIDLDEAPDTSANAATRSAACSDKAFDAGALDGSDTFGIKLGGDYLPAGNVQNILGQSATAIGASGTKPIHFLDGQLIKIPVYKLASDAAEDSVVKGGYNGGSDYMIAKLSLVAEDGNYIVAHATVVRPAAAGHFYVAGGTVNANADGVDAIADSGLGEADKCYVVGSAHAEGSGFPGTYKDTPYLVRTGYTQIFKTTCQMTNTARATQLKLVPDEWARIWKNKLIEHKYDIEQSLLFGRGKKDGTTGYTQGIVDFVLQEGNVFSWSTSKSQDDFLEDMSKFLDPRYNNSNATLFMCSTEVYNWLHKLSGYVSANVNEVSNGRFDMSMMAKSKKFGLDISTISTPYGDMNITRNIHLDSGQAGASIVAVNMKHVKYRPLAGNGVNRDTSIYVGVQSLENTGVDRRIDLIQTEAGLQCNMPEAHAVWK